MSDHYPHPDPAVPAPRAARTRARSAAAPRGGFRGPRGGAEVLLTLGLAGAVLAVLAGAVTVAVVLATSAAATDPLALGAGAAFVGLLAALLPGTAATLFLATSELVEMRAKVTLCLVPYLFTLALAVLAASLVQVVGRGGAPWVAAVAALGVTALACWIALRAWGSATAGQDARAARFARFRDDVAAQTWPDAVSTPGSDDVGADAAGAPTGPAFGPIDPGGPVAAALPPGEPADHPWDEPDAEVAGPADDALAALRRSPRTPVVGVALVGAALAVILVVAGTLATSSGYAPSAEGPVAPIISPVYATASGALASTVLWVPLWGVGAALLLLGGGSAAPASFARRPTPAARRAVLWAPPAVALACGAVLGLGLALGAIPGVAPSVVRTAVLSVLILGSAAVVWWVVRRRDALLVPSSAAAVPVLDDAPDPRPRSAGSGRQR